MSGFHARWKRTYKPVRITVYVILGIFCVSAVVLLLGIGIRLLWNWLMPALFGLGEITFWQAIGICVLAKLIFGFGMGGSNSDSKKTRKPRCDEGEADASWNEYEKWWEEKGKKAFEAYVNEKEASAPTDCI